MKSFREFLNEGQTFKIAKKDSNKGRTSEEEGTLEDLIDVYSYTLQKGADYQDERGNKKIDTKPKNIKALITNLNNAVKNAAANGNSSVTYSLVENINKNNFSSLKDFMKKNGMKSWEFEGDYEKLIITFADGNAAKKALKASMDSNNEITAYGDVEQSGKVITVELNKDAQNALSESLI